VDRAQQRAAQKPDEFMIRTYEGKTSEYVEIVGAVGPENYSSRSYFYLGDDPSNDGKGEYMCYIPTRMSKPPHSVTLPDDGEDIELVDPVDFAENGSGAQILNRRVTIIFVQSMPPNAFRTAKVRLT